MTPIEVETLRHARYWRGSALALGAALPFVIVYRPGIMYTLIAIGIITGLLAINRPTAVGHIRAVMSSRVVILIGAMLSAFFISAAFGNTPLYSLRKWVQLPLAAGGALALYIVLVEMPEKYRNTLLASLTTATVSITALLLIDLVVANPTFSRITTGDDEWDNARFNSWSSASAMLLPFIAAWLYATRKALQGWAPKAILSICVLGLVASGGRAGWVGAAAALIVWIAGMVRWRGSSLRPMHLAGLVFVALISVGFYWFVFGTEFLVSRFTLAHKFGVMSGRLGIWRVAIEHMGDSPLFGIGLSGYRHLPDATYIHPHNWFLQLGLETGVVGTVLYCGLVAWIALFYLTKIKQTMYALAGLTSLTAFAISGLANTSIVNMWWVTYFIVTTIAGVVLVSSASQRTDLNSSAGQSGSNKSNA